MTAAEPTAQYRNSAEHGRLFVGWEPRECGDHRTVGDYRAWCFDCSEWCYSRDVDMACKGCEIAYLRTGVERVRAEYEGAITWGVGSVEDARALDQSYSDWVKGHKAGTRDTRDRIEAALANHPDVCDRHNDGDVVTCGWKRAVIDVRRALDELRVDDDA